MARTIAEIKESIAADFMRNSDVARAYGFEAGAAFTSHFSRVNLFSYLYDICSMSFIESKNQCFGQKVHIWFTLRVIKQFRINHIPIGRKD